MMVRKAGERIAVNSPIQGTAADIIKKAMVDINGKFQISNVKSRMILQVHDELVFEVPEKETKQAASLVKKIMETTFPLSIPLVVELKVGKDWGNMKTLELTS